MLRSVLRICALVLTAFPATILALAAITPTRAAEWPARPVRIVVPFPAGGATDVLTRLLCERLAAQLNAPFIVENRGGAGGNVGGALVASGSY